MKPNPFALLVTGALLVAGCSGDNHSDHSHDKTSKAATHDHDHDHDHDHNHDHDHDHADADAKQDGHGHVHKAPRGGTLVELGDHFANVEFLLDREAGKLSAFILGAHAEAPVRIAQPSFDLIVKTDTAEYTLSLEAVASPLTGETVGDTSEFQVVDERLKSLTSFNGTIDHLTVRGQALNSTAFRFP